VILLVDLLKPHLISIIKNIKMIDYKKYITIDPQKRFGRPIILGTRISVYDVLNWLANGMTKQEIYNDFPELDENKINACLFFAANRENRIRVAS
jgi:uncharacterized protein (DUF433 family)